MWYIKRAEVPRWTLWKFSEDNPNPKSKWLVEFKCEDCGITTHKAIYNKSNKCRLCDYYYHEGNRVLQVSLSGDKYEIVPKQ